MQSGGTVLHSYGVTMEETVALITGANKTLQDPNVVKFLTFQAEMLVFIIGQNRLKLL